MAVSYLSAQRHVLEQAESSFLLSLLVVTGAPCGEDAQTVSLNSHRSRITQAATAS